MYYEYFGLTGPPFRITPDTEVFFGGGNRGPILEALIYAIVQGEGIVKVTGEVGSGKTMLCKMLQSRLPENVETVYLANPSVAPGEILHAIALDLQLKPPRNATHLEVMQMLHSHLLECHARGKQVVMFVEESQSMPLATLEEMRLLSNLETSRSKLLQIVLFGQPEFEDNLRQPNIRQLRERITHGFRLSPLTPGEIRDYLDFRVRAAGYRGPQLFPPAVIKAIARASAGLTRRVNLIADKTLLAAYSENTHTLVPDHVKTAVRECEFSNNKPLWRRLGLGPGLAMSLFVLGIGLGIEIYAMFLVYSDTGPPATAARAQPIAISPAPAAPPSAAARPPATIVVAPTSTPSPAAATPTAVGATPQAAAEKKTAPAPPEKPAAIQQASATHEIANGVGALEARLAATQKWLARQDKNTYSIQLLGTADPRQLQEHLNTIGNLVENSEIFVYLTVANQKPSLTVLYGAFNDRRAALEALAKLPAPLKVNQPILRTVQGIRDEIAHRPSS